MRKTELDKIAVEKLPVKKSLIDLEKHTSDQFTLLGYKLSKVFDDIVLAQYVDTADNNIVMRNGIALPLNAQLKAWRLGRVLLAGPNCTYTEVGDIVCFPNDKGIPVSNIDIEGYGVVRDGMFLNEQRLFGICKPADEDGE